MRSSDWPRNPDSSYPSAWVIDRVRSSAGCLAGGGDWSPVTSPWTSTSRRLQLREPAIVDVVADAWRAMTYHREPRHRDHGACWSRTKRLPGAPSATSGARHQDGRRRLRRGYSSLSYIGRFPIGRHQDRSKLRPGTRVRWARHHSRRAILDIARQISATTVAEGIEEGSSWLLCMISDAISVGATYSPAPVPAAEFMRPHHAARPS